MLTGTFVAAVGSLLVFLFATAWGIFCAVKDWKNPRACQSDRVLSTGSSLIGISVIALFLGSLFPYSIEYHSYKPISGTVIQVDKMFMSSGSSITESINLSIDGVDYTVDDTRAATVRRGDSVNLKCVKDWNYGAEDGWKCKWNGVNK